MHPKLELHGAEVEGESLEILFVRLEQTAAFAQWRKLAGAPRDRIHDLFVRSEQLDTGAERSGPSIDGPGDEGGEVAEG